MKFEEHVLYMGWPNCLRLYNDEAELIIAIDIGIRILHYGFIRGQNIFYLSAEDMGQQGGNKWKIYGGHRLWHAPEAIPRTYFPDNSPIKYSFDGKNLLLTQLQETITGLIKQIQIRAFEHGNRVEVLHRIINQNLWPVKLSVWAISVMRPGGTAVIPQEPYGEGDDYLLPTRSMALWSYTQMHDLRWRWGRKYIQASQDVNLVSEQKIGILNKQGLGGILSRG